MNVSPFPELAKFSPASLLCLYPSQRDGLLLLWNDLLLICQRKILLSFTCRKGHSRKVLHWTLPSLNFQGFPGSVLWNLAWLGIVTLYNNNNDSDNNYYVLVVYYMLLTVLYIHQVMQFLQPLFKRDSINLIYTRGNKDLEKPNNLLKDKVSLLSRFRVTTRAV